MANKPDPAEQTERLAAAFYRINDTGRDVLDRVVQQLADLHWLPPGSMKLGSVKTSHGGTKARSTRSKKERWVARDKQTTRLQP